MHEREQFMQEREQFMQAKIKELKRFFENGGLGVCPRELRRPFTDPFFTNAFEVEQEC